MRSPDFAMLPLIEQSCGCGGGAWAAVLSCCPLFRYAAGTKNCRTRVGERHSDQMPAAEPRLGRLVAPLLEVRRSLVEQIQTCDRCLIAIARRHAVVRRLVSVPGVGAVTAVAFVAAIDNPSRFRRSRHVGAYFGLAPRRYQSGEVDRPGRISKAGDQLVRTLLYEAANALLTRS